MKITSENIKNEVADYLNIPPHNIDAKSRLRVIVIPRQIAHYFCLKYDTDTTTNIGNIVGGVRRNTVFNGCRNITNLLDSNYYFMGIPIVKIVSDIDNRIRFLIGKPIQKNIKIFSWKTKRHINQKSLIVNL